MMTNPGPTAVPVQSNLQRSIRQEDAAMHITVSDPVQHSEGINKYISYRVDVRPPSTAPGEDQHGVILANMACSAVLRRYSDFFWLYEHLHLERAGAVVPPVPEKQPVGRFSPSFVEDRRANLERFLRRVAVHPELCDAMCLNTFLMADDVTFHAAKSFKGDMANNNMAASYAAFPGATQKKEGFKRWFAEAKTSISGDLVKSPDDELFEEIQRYVMGIDTQMKNVVQQSSSLVRKGKEIANGLFEFGLAFNLLGQSEADALGGALGKMGETADHLSVLSAEHAEKELKQFEEPLQDYIKMVNSVKVALQRRHEKRLTYSACLSELQSKQNTLGKLRMQIGAGAKVYAAEMNLRQVQESAEMARADFATVSQRVLREVDRFKREKGEDMRRTVLNYINLQVEYNKRMEETWGSLIPQFEQIQLDTNSNVNPAHTNQPNQTQGTIQQTHQFQNQMPSPSQQFQNQAPLASQQFQNQVQVSSQQPQYEQNGNTMQSYGGHVPMPGSVSGSVNPSNMLSVQYRDPQPQNGYPAV